MDLCTSEALVEMFHVMFDGHDMYAKGFWTVRDKLCL